MSSDSQKEVKNTNSASTAELTNKTPVISGAGLNKQPPRRGRKKVIVAALMIVVVGALAFGGPVAYKEWAKYREAVKAAQEQRSRNIAGDVMIAMQPAGVYDFKTAKKNLDELAVKHPEAYESRFYLLSRFNVCVELDDTPCATQAAKAIKATSAKNDPFANKLTKEQLDGIDKYAK